MSVDEGRLTAFEPVKDMEIQYQVKTHGKSWVFAFSVIDPSSQSDLGTLTAERKREDRLWERTCFEVFVQPKDSPEYWEINLAPNGSWNAYHFQNFRKGMAEENRISSLPMKLLSNSPQDFKIQFQVDLSLSFQTQKASEFRLGLSAVVLHQNRSKSHWALAHKSAKPDFHNPQSFLLPISL